MINKNRLWNAYYKGWFAGRAGRPYPPVDSMVEHSFMVDGYDLGRREAGRPSHMSELASKVSGELFGGADPSVQNQSAPSSMNEMSGAADVDESESGGGEDESPAAAAQTDG